MDDHRPPQVPDPGEPQKAPLVREPWMDLHPQITPEQWQEYYDRMTAREWEEYCQAWRGEHSRRNPTHPTGAALYGYPPPLPQYAPQYAPQYTPVKKKRGLWYALWPFLAFLGAIYVATFIAAIVVTVILVVEVTGSGQVIDENLIMDMVTSKVLQISMIVQVAVEVALIPVLIILIRRDAKLSAPRPFTKRTVGMLGLSIPIVFAACLVINIALNWLSAQMPKVMQEYEKLMDELFMGPPWLALFSVVIVAPVVEELVMRGLVMRRLRFVAGDKLAVLISALLFGLMHMNLVQGSYAFMLGVLIGWLYVRTDNLALPIFAHLLFNALGSGMLGWLIESIGKLIGHQDLLTAFENLPDVLLLGISLLIVTAFAVPYTLLTKPTAKIERGGV